MMQVLSINNDVGPFKTMSGHIFRPIFYPSCIPETPVDLTLNKSLLFGSQKSKSSGLQQVSIEACINVCAKVVHLFASYGPLMPLNVAASVFLKSSPFKRSRTTSMIIASKFNYES